MGTIEKLKKHFSDNKKVYISIGVTAMVVGTGAYILYVKKPTQILQINHSTIAEGGNVVLGDANTITTELIRRGHPGIKIKDLTTGVVYPSIRYAAKQTGLSRSNIMKCLSGAVSSVDGHTFVSLGDMI